MTLLQMTRVLPALVLAALLAACGGGSGGSAPVPPPVATPAPPEATPVPPPVVPVPTVPPVPPVTAAPPAQPSLKYPIPDGLWSAPSGAAPASGSYVYLQSDYGDYIGGGRTYSYTNADTLIAVTSGGLEITLDLKGNQNWRGGFLLPSAAAELQAGYFAGLTRTPFADRAVGGVEWTGDGRGCNGIKGWVVIDKIELTGGAITALDLRFEQHCEGGATALHGQIHWNKADVTTGAPVAGPAPIPAGLWKPAAGTVPLTGNYMFLESRQGDYIGNGRTYGYTQVNATITPSIAGGHLGVRIDGDQNWTGDFQAMLGLSQLTVGYYAGLQRYPFNNPVLGGLNWSGEGRGCNQLSGWFAIDKITYVGTTLTAIDLRFEQLCDGSSAPLRGQLHWAADDPNNPLGPVNPPPAGLWTPGTSFVAPAGNYVYLVSDVGDYIGAGRTELLTPANTTISVVTNLTAALKISVGGWDGTFLGMNTLSQLQPGYYGNLQRYPFHNAVRGGMDWDGHSRGCNTLSGWFVVDKVTYSLGELTAIDLRFEQHCEGAVPAQRGAIHWAK